MADFFNMHPKITALYFALILFLSFGVQNPVISVISCVFSAAALSILNTKKEKINNALFYGFLAVTITVINPLFVTTGSNVLFYFAERPFTLEALIYGGETALMTVSVLMWFNIFNKTFLSDKIYGLFGSKLYNISITFSLILRFVPLIKRKWHELISSLSGLGEIPPLYKGKIKFYLTAFSGIIGWALEHSVATAKSMKAKGFGTAKRTNYNNYKIKNKDVFLLIFIIFIAFFAVFITAKEMLTVNFYPVFTVQKPTAVTFAFYICFAFLSALPFISLIKEGVRWKVLSLEISALPITEAKSRH